MERGDLRSRGSDLTKSLRINFAAVTKVTSALYTSDQWELTMIDKNVPCTGSYRKLSFVYRCMTSNQLNYAKFMDLVHKKKKMLNLD